MSETHPTAADALAERVPFVWHETDFTVLPSAEWTYESLEHYENGLITRFLKEVLGEKEHDRFKALKPKAGDVDGFIKAIQKALGISGN